MKMPQDIFYKFKKVSWHGDKMVWFVFDFLKTGYF